MGLTTNQIYVIAGPPYMRYDSQFIQFFTQLSIDKPHIKCYNYYVKDRLETLSEGEKLNGKENLFTKAS